MSLCFAVIVEIDLKALSSIILGPNKHLHAKTTRQICHHALIVSSYVLLRFTSSVDKHNWKMDTNM